MVDYVCRQHSTCFLSLLRTNALVTEVAEIAILKFCLAWIHRKRSSSSSFENEDLTNKKRCIDKIWDEPGRNLLASVK